MLMSLFATYVFSSQRLITIRTTRDITSVPSLFCRVISCMAVNMSCRLDCSFKVLTINNSDSRQLSAIVNSRFTQPQLISPLKSIALSVGIVAYSDHAFRKTVFILQRKRFLSNKCAGYDHAYLVVLCPSVHVGCFQGSSCNTVS